MYTSYSKNKGVVNMAEKNNSVLTIRADEEIKAKFKALAETLGNQGTALESLLNTYEMQNAKVVITERKTDIEDFDAHLQAISSAFLHSLEITENTTERVRAEFQRQLDSKDNIISDLQKRIRQAEQAEQNANERVTAVESEMSVTTEQATIQLASLNSELNSIKKTLATVTEQVKDKQSLLDEYHTRLERAKQDIAELPELKEKTIVAEQARTIAEQEVARLTAELVKQKADFEAQISILKKEHAVDKQSAVLDERQKNTEKIESLNDKLQAKTETMDRLYTENDKLRKMVVEYQLTEKKNTSNHSDENN